MSRVLPILFNGDMVRAILDGRKTVTRRVIKFPVNSFNGRVPEADNVSVSTNTLWQNDVCFFDGNVVLNVKPPYGIGDILYVRETWAFIPCIDCMQDSDGKCLCNKEPDMHEDQYSVSGGCFVYRADLQEEEKGCIIWSPSIHMPKQAARIWLKVTSIRAERLQDILISGMKAEGAIPETVTGGQWQQLQREYMKPLWDSTIKKHDIDSYGWDANPWVWVIKFKRGGKPEEIR